MTAMISSFIITTSSSVAESERSLYNDDGSTSNSFEKGKYEILEFESEHNKRRLEIEFESETGTNFEKTSKTIELVVHNIQKKPKRIKSERKEKIIYMG